MSSKNCSKCGQLKLFTDFYKCSGKFDGLKSECKDCSKKRKTEYKKKFPEKIKQQDKQTKDKFRDRNKEIERNRYKNNTEQCKARNKKWRKDNPEYLREYYSQPQFRIAKNLRNRVRRALRGIIKSENTLSLIGMHIPEFMEYLSSRFQEGMSWENYGQWHIDHIRPCKSFDMSNESQQRECFHWSNMQPLWAIDNIIKSDNII